MLLRILVVISTLFSFLWSLLSLWRRRKITDVEISRDTMRTLMTQAFPKARISLWDNRYWHTSMSGWGIVFADIAAVPRPRYSKRFDCENHGFWTMVQAAARWGLNSCGIAVGNSPLGYHGWNVFTTSDSGVHMFDLLTGEVDPDGYEPDVIILGDFPYFDIGKQNG